MYGRSGLDRFKKAQSLEPFAVSSNSAAKSALRPTAKAVTQPPPVYAESTTSRQQSQYANPQSALQKTAGLDATATTVPTHVTQVGGGQSTWQPPDWAIEPRPGVYYLEVIKDGEVLDRINLDKRRHLFGRQFHTCDFVLDHQSVSRQHAAVIPHKNGSIYVIDLGSAHGTFVANERLTKDSPVELEPGQSLKFAASTRTYILRKNNDALFPPRQTAEIDLPPPPDPSDEEAVLVYNTFLNRYGLTSPDTLSKSAVSTSGKDVNHSSERPTKRIRRTSVSFKDQVGGELVEVVGISDGADVETEPGPLGVKEGSLVGKYESLVETMVIPKGKEQSSARDVNFAQTGVTDKLKQVLNKVKNPPKGGIYDDLYGESVPSKLGSWAYSGIGQAASTNDAEGDRDSAGSVGRSSGSISSNVDDDTDDLFG